MSRRAVASVALFAMLVAPTPILADAGTGAIGGTVYDAAGAPAADVLVYVCNGTCTHTTTDWDGAYSVAGLVAGVYRVGIEDVSGKLPGGYVSLAGLTVSAAGALGVQVGATSVTLDVHAPAGQQISGIVTDSAGSGVRDTIVAACVISPGLAPDEGFVPCGIATTAADGSYALAALPARYEVFFLDPAGTHASGYYASGGPVLAESRATAVVVGAADVVGIDAALPAGQEIAGTVTDASGAPAAGITAEACRTTESDACLSDTTGADGSYAVQGLPIGSYDVAFFDPAAAHPTGYYGTGGFTGDSAGAKGVSLGTTGATGIDVQLPAGHVISGNVTDAAGAPARVVVDDCTSALCIPVAVTASDGSYRIDVATGVHTVHVRDYSGANLSGFYAAAGLANGLHASTLTVGSSDIGGIDVRLRRIGAGVHAGTGHRGTYGTSTVVARGTYVTVRFSLGKTFAGTRVQIQRAVKYSSGAWSAYRGLATAVVAADGNAYYSVKVSGTIAFRAAESDTIVAGVTVLSAPVFARGR